MTDVVANVSQHSRESGRVPVHILAERLENERQSLIKEKREIESELALLSADKNDAMARKAYGNGYNPQATVQIKAEFTRKRHDLLKRKEGIEERMYSIKATMHEKQLMPEVQKYPDVVVLLRIEELLTRLCKRLNA